MNKKVELHLEPASIDVFLLDHEAGLPDSGTPRLAALPLGDQPHDPRRIWRAAIGPVCPRPLRHWSIDEGRI